MAAKLSQGLEDHVTCPICLEQYQDPRILPCLHTYCRRCLEDLLDKGHRKSSIECPECREVVQVKDVTSLRVNIWINRSLSLLELSKAENNEDGEPALLCNNCDSKEPAKARCFDCERFVCGYCITAHDRMEVLKNHQLMTLEEINTTGIPVMDKPTLCDRHKGKKQKLFCQDCKILICKDCTLIDHKDHDFSFIADVAEKYKEKLQKKSESTSSSENKIASAMKSVKDMQGRVRINSEVIEKEIDDTIDSKIQALEERRTSLKQESRNITALKMKRLSAHEDGLLMHSIALKSAVQFTENILTKGSTSDILSMVKELSSRLCELSEKDIDNEVDVEDGVELEVDEKTSFVNIIDFAKLRDSSAPDPGNCDLEFNKHSSGHGLIRIWVKNYTGEPIWIKKDRIRINCHFQTNLSTFGSGKKSESWEITGDFKFASSQFTPDSTYVRSSDVREIKIFIDGQPVKGSPAKVIRLNFFSKMQNRELKKSKKV